MDEILVAFILSMLLGLCSLIRFDKICIFVFTITLLVVNYTSGLDKTWVDVGVVVLWTVVFYMVVVRILSIVKSSNSNESKLK